ncbi:hypothetical protein BGZ67_006180 [Mortierella alpina]|nr:hypothetical protein BGZ67_006180 [Mortierella alpina]
MASRTADKRTTFEVRNLATSVLAKDLSSFLGLGQEAIVTESGLNRDPTNQTKSLNVSVNTLDEAMAVFRRHNFTKFGDRFIQLAFLPREIYNSIPLLQIRVMNKMIEIKDVYSYFRSYGFVISVFQRSAPRCSIFDIYYNDLNQARSAAAQVRGQSFKNARSLTGLVPKKPILKNTDFAPVFWTPPPVPQKTKGSLIGVPTNITVPAKSAMPIVQVAHVVKGAAKDLPGSHAGPSIQQGIQRTAAEQRLHKGDKSVVHYEYCLQPGEIIPDHIDSRFMRKPRAKWYDSAFISYETLYNLSSQSTQGLVSISTLAWGSQLDISTFRLHYGSSFTPKNTKVQCPVASCLTVEMRQYGDKESAAEVLGIRNTGRLPVSSDALAEGINITARGAIMAMKCLESGHLVTASKSKQGDSDLYVWDMRDSSETAKVATAKLYANQKGSIWFDARGMDVCSVDRIGTIRLYDLTKTVASSERATPDLDYMSKADIDMKCNFYSSSISINGFDSTVLVGSSEHAQVARWDSRSPSAPSTTTSCLDKGQRLYGRSSFDPIYDVEWNPNNSNEFMTVHKRTVRVWDARKMDQDSFATFHNLGEVRLRKAAWSPHRTDVIAGLTFEGQVRIWRINKFDGPADPTTLEQQPEPFRVISDFAWCPYLEDVISTVAPGTVNEPGNIQVWRPRNMHSSDDHGEP